MQDMSNQALGNLLAILQAGGEVDRITLVEIVVEAGLAEPLVYADYREPLRLTAAGHACLAHATDEYETIRLTDDARPWEDGDGEDAALHHG